LALLGCSAVDRAIGGTDALGGFLSFIGRMPRWLKLMVVVGAVAVVAGGGTFLIRARCDTRTLSPRVGITSRAGVATPLQESALENVTAFTRLYGYVRFFHPSDAVAKQKWNQFAVYGVQAVEDAETSEELARRLQLLFEPIAPAVRVAAAPEPQPARAKLADRVMVWRHRSLAGRDTPFYSNNRVQIDPDGSRLPQHGPRRPFVVELPRGVHAEVPIAAYVNRCETLPRSSAVSIPVQSGPSAERATRLATIAVAWNLLQHFSPYLDVVKVDWGAELPKALRAAATETDPRKMRQILYRMQSSLGDGHFSIQPPPDVLLLPLRWELVEDVLVVTNVKGGETSVSVGDVVEAVDGVIVRDALRPSEAFLPGATATRRRLLAAQNMLAGSPDSTTELTLRKPDGTVVHQRLRHSLPLGDFLPPRYQREEIEELEPTLFYVDLRRIDEDDFRRNLAKLSHANGVIFDLRGYPENISEVVIQHLIDRPAVRVGKMAIPSPALPDRRQMRFEPVPVQHLQPRKPRLDAKVAFLTDANAISYSESYLAYVEYYKLGSIVGSPTAGTNGNITNAELPNGWTMSWSGMRISKHDGSQLFGVGIQPTVRAEPTVRGLVEGRDEVLERAVQEVTAG
jgi:C-terminal processing protease CtpA/Prc